MTDTKALDAIVRAADEQLSMLQEAARRPEVDTAHLAQQCLELLLDAMARSLSSAPRFAPFVARVQTLQKSSVQASQHLLELAEGWVCPHCENDVPAAAAIASGALRIACRACGKQSSATAAGQAHFKKVFGHLAVAGWQPELNGFVRAEDASSTENVRGH
jgi:hypothetical protein